MKFQPTLLLLLAATMFAAATAQTTPAQHGQRYQHLSEDGRTAFVSEQARRIGRELSGTEYEFTPAFVAEIQKAVDSYARRVGTGTGDQLWKGDLRLLFERGQTFAPTLMEAFRARNVSPLIGLYLPFIESEYVNLQNANHMGAVGMFQFLPPTGRRFGLDEQGLLDVGKAADAAARYIANNLKQFSDDPMKEALALLAYNRGEGKVARDLKRVVDEQNKRCSICALTAARDQLDKTFQTENFYYVPRFFAAAIVGENPQAFGLSTAPLSSFETKR